MTKFPKDTDIVVRFQGASTVWTFEPITDTAKDLLDQLVKIESWQWVGNAFGVDHRFGPELVELFLGAGFGVYHPTYGFAGPR